MIRLLLSGLMLLSVSIVRGQGCTAFIDAYISSPTGTHQRTGQFFINVESDCFALASPENPIYIRVGFDRDVTLSETLVDPFESGPHVDPIDLAVRLYTLNQPNLLNKTPRDAISIVRWKEGESAFWLKITSSSSTWINDGTTTVPPSPSRCLEFFVGHSAWESQETMAQSGFMPNMNRSTRRNGEPASTIILANINNSGLIIDPDPALSILNYEIQAMDSGTTGVTTEPLEQDIQFGSFLPHISFPMLMYPRVCMVVRAGDWENILYPANFPDKNFRDFMMHRFTFLTRTFALDEAVLTDFPGLIYGIPLPIRDLTGLHFFENLEVLNCEGEPIQQISDLSTLTALRELHLARNQISRLPDLPPSIEDVEIAFNPLREIGPLTAVSGLGTQSHHRIVLDRNLLSPSACPDLSVLEARTDVSGAQLSYGLQGGIHGQNISFPQWPTADIRTFVEDMIYVLECPPL